MNGLASTPYNVAAGGTDFSDSYQTNFTPTSYWNNNDISPYGSASVVHPGDGLERHLRQHDTGGLHKLCLQHHLPQWSGRALQ